LLGGGSVRNFEQIVEQIAGNESLDGGRSSQVPCGTQNYPLRAAAFRP